mgnify:FL=1
MPAQWTAEVVGDMHLNGITAKQLAVAIGWNPKYLSQILNGHVMSKHAEAKVRAALQTLIADACDAHNQPSRT